MLSGLCAELARAGIGDERHADLRTDIEHDATADRDTACRWR